MPGGEPNGLQQAQAPPTAQTEAELLMPTSISAAAELLGVELARPGTWQLSSGDQTFTEQMLHDAARFAARADARPSPVKIGHVDKRFDGEPALGWLGNLRVADDNGPVLLGDITGMPDWLAATAPTAWPDRSVEGWTDYEADGETYSFVIDGLALLGVTPPGMSSIRSLRDLPQALGVAASARIYASFGAPTAPAPEAEESKEKESGMDPAKIREALGLSADASDDEVRSAVVTAGLAPPTPAPAPLQASLFDTAPQPKTEPAKRELAGVIRVEASAWEAAQDRIKKLEAQEARRVVAERDEVITQAIREGKFAPTRRAHWQRLWDVDPDGAREALDGLAKNVIPVMASGYAGEDETDLDAEFKHLFPQEARRG